MTLMCILEQLGHKRCVLFREGGKQDTDSALALFQVNPFGEEHAGRNRTEASGWKAYAVHTYCQTPSPPPRKTQALLKALV